MAMTSEQRRQARDEQLATDFGTQGQKALEERFTETRTYRKFRGKDNEGEMVTERFISAKNRRRIRAAGEEFNARGSGAGVASAQNRGASGGGVVSTGDFGPGAIRLNTVTPVNSKTGGR